MAKQSVRNLKQPATRPADAADADRAGPRATLPRSRLRNVAILVGTTGAYGRGILRGIAKYNREREGWSTYFHPQISAEIPPQWMTGWDGDGVLGHVNVEGYGELLSRLKVPFVNLRLMTGDMKFPYVGVDHSKVGQMAAEHLMGLGLEHFGFYGSAPGTHFGLDERARAFKGAIEAAGRSCSMLTFGRSAGEGDSEQSQKRLSEWIQSLPKPVGVMASNDERGLQILAACRRCGVRVPDDVAVIGVDNDEMMCDLAIPPLSSIDVNGEHIGYQAAAKLDAMMDGSPTAAEAMQILPRGVVTRRSTDVIASEDPEVNRAISFIRAYSGRAISVVDVLAHLNMSRAALQQRMKRVLGRTIHEEIERVRLTRVKDLLVTSDMTIKQITLQAGFSSVQYMTRVFRGAVGETPAQFRRERRN